MSPLKGPDPFPELMMMLGKGDRLALAVAEVAGKELSEPPLGQGTQRLGALLSDVAFLDQLVQGALETGQ